MSAKHIRFDDEVEYEPTDSEEEYTPHEKKLLEKASKRQEPPSESEDEVYGVHSDTGSEIALSDVEGQEDDDDLPDVRAWGKDKRHFYSTDYVDPDYGGYQGKDAALADREEEEARNLQKQLMQQLDDDDFTLDIINKKVEVEDKKKTEEFVKTDISKLSKRQKIDLLLKESPEFFGLVEDFKNKIAVAEEFLNPIIKLSKNDKISDCEALDFVKTHYEIILNYCTNISMYLLLKASRVNMQSHPVVKRLYQYRQLLAQLDPIFESTIKPQIKILIDENKNLEKNPEIIEVPMKKKTLKVLTKSTRKSESSSISDDENLKPPKKKLKKLNGEPEKTVIKEQLKKVKFNLVGEANEHDKNNVEEKNEDEEMIENEAKTDIATDGVSRRGITYQIAKNKGLTPHRNKLQRNPRVKHRNKYRQAKIRRKGAIREVRTELSRYGGELSGIKASVTKSIKIKS